jgi:hypothetical protein
MSVSPDGDAVPDPGSGSGAGSNPITIDPGKGWLLRLPVPREVVGKLGGPARLGERLRPIMDTKLDQFGPLTPDARDQLASAYDDLFQQLAAIPAERRASGETGSGETAGPGHPIDVDPHQGRSVTLPMPEQVLGKLGGASRVGERLRPILDGPAVADGALTPDARDQLASAYGEVLQHLTAASRRAGQR